MEVVIDIETDGLDATLVHCVVAKDTATGQLYTWQGSECYSDTFKEFVRSVSTFIGHNIVSFDVPIMNKLLGTDIKQEQLVDTLILSQLINPIRDGGHSLEAWGTTLNCPKVEFGGDFSVLTDLMVSYCQQDVQLTHRVYITMLPEIKKITPQCIELEHKIRYLLDQQENTGFTLDVQKAMILKARLLDRSSVLEQEVKDLFKPMPVYVRDVVLKMRMNGSLSMVGLGHIDDINTVAGPHSVIEYPTFNLNSRHQIAKHMIQLGWKPTKFTDKGQVIVDEAVLKDVDLPEAKKISEYLLVEKRATQIQSWLDAADHNNKIHGRVLTLRTISGRMAHSSPNMAQVPANYSPYGKECRECFIAPDDKTSLVGCDASSLELRCLAHYLNDPKFTAEVVTGDIHTANQKAAGLSTRDQAKTFIYAFIFGAGAAKIGLIVGGNAKDGQRLINTFLSNVPSLAVFRNRVDVAAKRGFLIGLDGRRLIVRSQHAALNLLIQGAGAVICKNWLVEINRLKDKSVKLVASIHDEYQFESPLEVAETFGQVTKVAMKNVEAYLKVKCKVDSEFKIGRNWKETH